MDPMEQDTADSNNSTMQRHLPPALQLHILSFLSHNDRALSGRLVSQDAATALGEPQHCTASLSQPLPPHAVPWAIEAGQRHMRQLPFQHKLQLLSTAAISGSEVNLEVALALLQPSIFPELLHSADSAYTDTYVNAAEAAVKSGNVRLLGWLQRRCRALCSPALECAAHHCDLAGLQAVWAELQDNSAGGGHRHVLHQQVLDAAARSSAPDAVAKMEWLLATAGQGGGSCSLQGSTAVVAACSGDLGRLRWLHDGGCPMDSLELLQCTLRHADLAVAQWLVDEAGFPLPERGSSYSAWKPLLRAAAMSPDAVTKWQWLKGRGAPWLDRGEFNLLYNLAVSAVEGGQVEVLQHLQSMPGLSGGQSQELERAVMSGAQPVHVPMARYLHQQGRLFTHAAYASAMRAASVDMIRWLAREAGVFAGDMDMVDVYYVMEGWSEESAADSRDLLEAVQLMVEAGCVSWDVDEVVGVAATRGDLALVQYMLQLRPHENYQPAWHVFVLAAMGGCEALLEQLVELAGGALGQLPCGGYGSPHMQAAAAGDRGTLDALRRLGVPWGARDMVVQAVRRCVKVPVLRWLVEQGAPVGSKADMEEALEQAAGRGWLTSEDAAWLRGLTAEDIHEQEA